MNYIIQKLKYNSTVDEQKHRNINHIGWSLHLNTQLLSEFIISAKENRI